MNDLYNKAKNRANDVRNRLGLGDEPISNIFKILENEGIFLFKRPIQSNISAIFLRSQKDHLVILNTNKTLGHQIFSCAHELSHFLYDQHIMGGVCIVNKTARDIEIEQLADYFASNFLMPEDGILKHIIRRTGGIRKIDTSDIIFLQQYYNVSLAAMLFRLFTLGHLTQEKYEYFKETIRIKRDAALFGYSTGLYEKDQSISYSQNYIEMAMRAFTNDEISERKLEKLLQDIGAKLSDFVLDDDQSLIEEESY